MEGGADEERELSCRNQPQERSKRPQRGAQYGPMAHGAPRGARVGSKRGPRGLQEGPEGPTYNKKCLTCNALCSSLESCCHTQSLRPFLELP